MIHKPKFKELKWTASKASNATVSSTCLVKVTSTGNSSASAVITATAQDGSKQYGSTRTYVSITGDDIKAEKQ